MRVVYIGDARNIEGVGMLAAGTVYDLPDHVAASLMEQGRAELPPPPKPPAPSVMPATKPAEKGARNG